MEQKLRTGSLEVTNLLRLLPLLTSVIPTTLPLSEKTRKVLNLAGHQHDGEVSTNTDSRVQLLEIPNHCVWGGGAKSVSDLVF